MPYSKSILRKKCEQNSLEVSSEVETWAKFWGITEIFSAANNRNTFQNG